MGTGTNLQRPEWRARVVTRRRPGSEVRDAPTAERPRERLIRYGPRALTDAELLAIILRSGGRGQTALDVARQVLDDFDGLAGLAISSSQVQEQAGIGTSRAATLLAAIELGCRLARAEMPPRRLLDRPQSVARYLRLRYALGVPATGARHIWRHGCQTRVPDTFGATGARHIWRHGCPPRVPDTFGARVPDTFGARVPATGARHIWRRG